MVLTFVDRLGDCGSVVPRCMCPNRTLLAVLENGILFQTIAPAPPPPEELA